MLNAVKSVIEKWKERNEQKHRGTSFRVGLTEQGFDVFEQDCSEPTETVRWDALRSIRSYKRDVFAYDIICLAFEIEADSWVEISDKDDGFDAVRWPFRSASSCRSSIIP